MQNGEYEKVSVVEPGMKKLLHDFFNQIIKFISIVNYPVDASYICQKYVNNINKYQVVKIDKTFCELLEYFQ